MNEAQVGLYVRSRERVKVVDGLRVVHEARGLTWLGAGDPSAADRSQRLLVLPPQGEWISVLPEQPKGSPGLAQDLALAVGAEVLLVGQLDEMAFYYEAFDRGGARIDAYHSCPDYAKEFEEDDASQAELESTRGRPERIAEALGGAELGALPELLTKARIERLRDHDPHQDFVPIDASLAALAAAFGLPDLQEGFLDHLDLGSFDLEGSDPLLLACAEPEEPGKLEQLWSRWRGKDAPEEQTSEQTSGLEAAPPAEPLVDEEEPESAAPDEDDDAPPS